MDTKYTEKNTNYVLYGDIENFINSLKDNIAWINTQIETAPAEKIGYWTRRKNTEESTLGAVEIWAKDLTLYINNPNS